MAKHFTGVIASVWLIAVLASASCGGDSEPALPPTVRSTTAVVEARARPVRVKQLDLNSCNSEGQSDAPVIVIAHESNAERYIAPVKEALTRAVDQSRSVYGWASEKPICVHMFASDDAFVQGLEQLGGLSPNPAEDYRQFFGTNGIDLATGRDAVYMNTIVSRGPNWVPYVATHEYFHIIQGHVGCSECLPTWFLEGMADWEAIKLLGDPETTWQSVLVTEQRAGRYPPLSALTTSEQWNAAQGVAWPYYKARGAIAYLEDLAGSRAVADILRDSAAGSFNFQFKFPEVTGIGLDQFEAGLLPFFERLAIRTTVPTPVP